MAAPIPHERSADRQSLAALIKYVVALEALILRLAENQPADRAGAVLTAGEAELLHRLRSDYGAGLPGAAGWETLERGSREAQEMCPDELAPASSPADPVRFVVPPRDRWPTV